MIAFSRVQAIYIIYILYTCIYSCVHLDEYALYLQLRKLCHSRRLDQLMGVACNRTCARALQTNRKKERKLLVAYIETTM